MTDKRIRQCAQIISIPLAVGAGLVSPSVITASAAPGIPGNHDRLNNGIVVNVDTIKKQAGCKTNLKINPQLQSAAQRHAVDVLNNRGLDADIGSDGSSVADRARGAGPTGTGQPATRRTCCVQYILVMGCVIFSPPPTQRGNISKLCQHSDRRVVRK